jgi:hypothetical protein
MRARNEMDSFARLPVVTPPLRPALPSTVFCLLSPGFSPPLLSPDFSPPHRHSDLVIDSDFWFRHSEFPTSLTLSPCHPVIRSRTYGGPARTQSGPFGTQPGPLGTLLGHILDPVPDPSALHNHHVANKLQRCDR